MTNSNDALIAVFERNDFYKRMHFLALGAFGLALTVICFLIAIIYFLERNPPKPLYFATDSIGRLIKIIPVGLPNMTTDEASAWAVEAVQAAYSFDYVNYRQQLQSAQKYFTDYGWREFMSQLTASNNLLAITQRKMIAIAQVVDKPKLIADGALGDTYAWKFQMPVLITYSWPPYDDKSKYSNAQMVSVLFQRRPELESYKGVGIVQFIGELLTSTSQSQQILNSSPGQGS